jgi:hypothetical protein
VNAKSRERFNHRFTDWRRRIWRARIFPSRKKPTELSALAWKYIGFWGRVFWKLCKDAIEYEFQVKRVPMNEKRNMQFGTKKLSFLISSMQILLSMIRFFSRPRQKRLWQTNSTPNVSITYGYHATGSAC